MNYFEVAINEAKKAYCDGDVPVGCVIVCNGKIIAAAHNTKNSSNVAVNHAEILAIIEACKFLDSWYLSECELYVTLKPCAMCVAAIAEARIGRVYYLLDTNYDDNLSKNIANIKFIKNEVNMGYNELISSFFVDLRG